MDVANGPGIRVSLFVTGCSIHCPNCFNELFQDFTYGTPWSDEVEEEFIALGQRPHINGYSILGGEPLEQDKELLHLLKRIKTETNKTIWLWSGKCYETLSDAQKEVLNYVDVLVDGPFLEEKKDLSLRFRGSSNQRIIDLNKSRSKNEIVIWQEYK